MAENIKKLATEIKNCSDLKIFKNFVLRQEFNTENKPENPDVLTDSEAVAFLKKLREDPEYYVTNNESDEITISSYEKWVERALTTVSVNDLNKFIKNRSTHYRKPIYR